MLFIVVHHCIVSGLGLNETLNNGGECFSSSTICLIIMNAFVIISVNVFFLISGYFGIKLRAQKMKKLLEEVLFYSVAIYAVCVLIGVESLTFKNILKYTILSMQVHKKLMLKIMSECIAAHHLLCLFVQLAIDKNQRLIKIERK